MGSKNRIAKHILPIILKNRRENQWYVEPFVGGANLIDKVDGNRLGNDTNPYLIALLQKMAEGINKEDIPFIGEKEYQDIKKNKEKYPDWLVGYVGFQLSFAAKFFGGYRRDQAGVRDYSNEAKQNILAQQNSLKGVVFVTGDYLDLEIPCNSIVYCDPPYKDTTKYSHSLDYEVFYRWLRKLHTDGHCVFVSEYNMPPDFKIVWEKEVSSNLDVKTKGKKETEKLYTL